MLGPLGLKKGHKKKKKTIFFWRKFLKYNCNVGTHISALLSHWDQLAIRLGKSTSWTRPLGEAVTFSWMVLGGCKSGEKKTLRITLGHATSLCLKIHQKVSFFQLYWFFDYFWIFWVLKVNMFTVFENHRKSLIQHCERSELCLHFEWTKVN